MQREKVKCELVLAFPNAQGLGYASLQRRPGNRALFVYCSVGSTFDFTRSFILQGKRRHQPLVLSIAVKEYLNVIADQAETSQGGVVTPAMREAIIATAAKNPDIIVWVDSRCRAEHFRGVIVKPNQQEAEAAATRALGRIDFPALRRHMNAPLLIVTPFATI